jgi:hypothetical protein
MLIEMGALLNKKDILGHSAIYYAIHYRHEECLKLMLLNMAQLTPEDAKKAQEDRSCRKIMELGQSIMGIIHRMPYEKRRMVFESELKHLV